MNIPLHIAEQGKEKIQEYLDLREAKDKASRALNESEKILKEIYRTLQDIFIEDESGTQWSYKTYKRKSFYDYMESIPKPYSELQTLQMNKKVSQFADQIWTLNQSFQEAAMVRVEKVLLYREACNNFDKITK